MKDIIAKKLDEIEKCENIKILHCVESGSRAWGFASPDSDYDVRFIYIRPREFYLRLDKTRDVIEWQLDDTLDINGWDIKKALQLLHKSNPTVFEWNASPIVYRTTEEWTKVAEVIPQYFSPMRGLYHYLSTAKSNFNTYLKNDTVKYKKYFYILRPILACKWILDKGTPPPMLFSTLMHEYLDISIKADVERLLEIKTSTSEIGEGKHFERVDEYLDKNIKEIEAILLNMTEEKDTSWNTLNELFISLINEVN